MILGFVKSKGHYESTMEDDKIQDDLAKELVHTLL